MAISDLSTIMWMSKPHTMMRYAFIFSLSMQSTNFTISKYFLVVCDFTVLVLGSVSELKHVVVKTVYFSQNFHFPLEERLSIQINYIHVYRRLAKMIVS